MNMTPEASELLNELDASYRKAAFYAKNYRVYKLPEVAIENLSLPADSWNAGHDSRIFIPKGAKIRLVYSEEAHKLGVGGTEADRLKGLWVSEFSYENGDRTKGLYIKPETKVFDLLKGGNTEEIISYGTEKGYKVHTHTNERGQQARVVAPGWVLDSDNGGEPTLFIRPSNAIHDHWLQYDAESQKLHSQDEHGEWKLVDFD